MSPIAIPLSTPGKNRNKTFLASFPKHNNIYLFHKNIKSDTFLMKWSPNEIPVKLAQRSAKKEMIFVIKREVGSKQNGFKIVKFEVLKASMVKLVLRKK